MDESLWFDHWEGAYHAFLAKGWKEHDAWMAAAQVADQAIADRDAIFMDAAVDAAKER